VRLVAALGLVTVMTGCGYSLPRLSFAVEQRILRETTLDDMPADQAEEGDGTVRIIRLGKDMSGSCSGALVDESHVVTAAHCVVDRTTAKELVLTEVTADHLHVELGSDYLPWGRVGIQHVRVCDGYVGDAVHDVAVVLLNKPVPRKVRTLPIAWGELPSEGAPLVVSGFGSVETLAVVPDTRWPVFVSHRHVHTGPLYYASKELLAVGSPGVHGDSGGPIVDSASGHLVSIVSRGVGAPDEDDDPILAKLGPIIAGPRLSTCRRAIVETLRLRP
jgi:hypothetical protein